MAHRKTVRHYHEPGHFHEFTFSCFERRQLLTNDVWREKLSRCIDAAGEETRRVLEANSRPDYRAQLEKELKAIADSEMWQAGTVVRSLRPERAAKSRG